MDIDFLQTMHCSMVTFLCYQWLSIFIMGFFVITVFTAGCCNRPRSRTWFSRIPITHNYDHMFCTWWDAQTKITLIQERIPIRYQDDQDSRRFSSGCPALSATSSEHSLGTMLGRWSSMLGKFQFHVGLEDSEEIFVGKSVGKHEVEVKSSRWTGLKLKAM